MLYTLGNVVFVIDGRSLSILEKLKMSLGAS